jgi:peptidoglycan/LPS O-acetylase OafA/YrhL
MSIPPLDGLRGIAALLVLMTHVGFVTGSYGLGPIGATLARFDIGVALFFALSGFLLTRPWVPADARPSVRRYALRRAARILPAYWVALLVVLLTTDRGAPLGAIVSNATLTQVYTGHFLDGYTQTWSLCTEVAFYVALPFLAPWVARTWYSSQRRGMLLMCSLIALSLVWIAVVASDLTGLSRIAALWLPGHLSWFVGGMMLALAEPLLRNPTSRLSIRLSAVRETPWALVALAAALFALSCTAIAGPLTLIPPTPLTAVIKEVLYLSVAVLLVFAAGFAADDTGLYRMLSGRVGRALGRVSYGVFLWHLVVIEGLRQVFGIDLFDGGLVLLAVSGIAVTYLVAEISWRVVELPLLRRAGAHPR